MCYQQRIETDRKTIYYSQQQKHIQRTSLLQCNILKFSWVSTREMRSQLNCN